MQAMVIVFGKYKQQPGGSSKNGPRSGKALFNIADARPATGNIADPKHASGTTMHAATSCVFCSLPAERIVDGNALAIAIRDGFPISPGHTLVIPRRHVGSFFETTTEERTAMLALLDRAKHTLDEEAAPDAYNIGINDGAAAGQTVAHLHMHLIPRFAGDLPDPRGGVRWVIPDKADYWSGR